MHSEIRTALDQAYQRVIESNQLILSEEVEQFAKEFAIYSEAKHAIGVGNGLDALFLTLKAMGICAGDEVIVPSNTYIGN